MKNTRIFAVLMSAVILASCGTSHDVVDGGLFQKRKYNKGFHISKKSNIQLPSKSSDDASELDVAFTTDNSEILIGKTVSTEGVLTNENSEQFTTLEVKDQNEKNGANVKLQKNQSLTVKKNVISRLENLPNRKLMDKIIFNAPIKMSKNDNVSDINENLMDGMTVLLIILAIIIPPLAVFLYEGATSRFWIDLLLAILGWGVGFYFLGGLGWAAGLAAVIYALLIVLGAI